MNTLMTRLGIALLIVGISGSAAFADQDHNPRKKHNRQAQVDRRANREEAKNDAAAAQGKITNAQKNKLNQQDQDIKQQAAAEKAANGGHLTRDEQRQLNKEENGVNRERNRMERRDAAKGSAPSTGTTNPSAPSAPAAPAAPAPAPASSN